MTQLTEEKNEAEKGTYLCNLNIKSNNNNYTLIICQAVF